MRPGIAGIPLSYFVVVPYWSEDMETISAVYEDGVFKPLRPVALSPGARVRVEPEPTTSDLAERTYQQLLAEGATADEARSSVDNFRLAWDVYDSLTEQQKKGLEDCRIDQVNFFSRPSP